MFKQRSTKSVYLSTTKPKRITKGSKNISKRPEQPAETPKRMAIEPKGLAKKPKNLGVEPNHSTFLSYRHLPIAISIPPTKA